MFRVLLKKYFGESILLWSACAAMLIVFPWVRIWTVCQFDLSGFAPLLEQLRSIEKFSPVPLEQFLTYEGMIALTFDEPILILCVLVWSIARGSDLVSGEIGRGTMEMLLAQPTSRIRIVAAHGFVSVFGLALLCTAAWIGIYCGIKTNSVPVTLPRATLTIPGINLEIANPWSQPQKAIVPLIERVAPSLYGPAILNLFGFGFLVFSLSVLASSYDNYRWRTIGVVISIYVLQVLLYILAKSTPKFRGLMPLSFLAAYQPDWITQVVHQHPEQSWLILGKTSAASTTWDIGPLGYSLLLITLGIIMYAFASLLFCRRDIPAPQ